MINEIEISYKSELNLDQAPSINGSSSAYKAFMQKWDMNKIEMLEHFNLLLLNRANKVIGFCNLFQGGTSATVVDTKIVFATALKAVASGIIIAHNHPSGSLKPSRADEELTKKLVKAGQILKLPILDHLIVTKHTYFSFADEGLM